MSNIIVESSIPIGTTIVPWNEVEIDKLKKEKETFLKEKQEQLKKESKKEDKKEDKKDNSKNTKSKKVGEK